MECPLWLPPLNSHEFYTTKVTASQSEEPMIVPEYAQKLFLIRVYVDVTFYSKSELIPLKGLSVRDTDGFLASCCTMIYTSREHLKKFISDILGYMHIPFQLDHIRFTESHLKNVSKNLKPNYNLSLEDCVTKLQDFLYVMSCKSYNAGHNVLPVNLEIKKSILISSDELETWLSWFQEKERVNPNFRLAYLKAISRPRTVQELLDAETMKFKGVKKSCLAVLQDENPINESSLQCMVCLEEFSGLEAVRLPCSHMFHKLCITKWLQERNMCPLCRSTFPSD